jgi:hypothetical protein
MAGSLRIRITKRQVERRWAIGVPFDTKMLINRLGRLRELEQA